MKARAILWLAGTLVFNACSHFEYGNEGTAAPVLKFVGGDSEARRSQAVVVEAGNLVWTGSIDAAGSANELDVQVAETLRRLSLLLAAADSGLENLVRLHVQVANAEDISRVEEAIARELPEASRPAMVILQAALGDPGLLVAMDAVAATAAVSENDRPRRAFVSDLTPTRDRISSVSILAQGPMVFISGRAAPGGDVLLATKGTLDELTADLATVGLDWAHVAQIRVFLQPMSGQKAVLDAVEAVLPGELPPVVFVEWLSDSRPVEIELVAGGGNRTSDREPLDFFEGNARFSRIARINRGAPVFVGALDGGPGSAADQVAEQFVRLDRVLAEAGSERRHLAKATYFVADPGADVRLNEIRPEIFESGRAPAASKAAVRGAGLSGQKSAFDIIAIRP